MKELGDIKWIFSKKGINELDEVLFKNKTNLEKMFGKIDSTEDIMKNN